MMAGPEWITGLGGRFHTSGWTRLCLGPLKVLPRSSPVLGLGLLAPAAHLAVRRFVPYADPPILPLAVLLTGFGLVPLDRLDFSYRLAHAAKGDWQKVPTAPSQPTWVVIAVVAAVVLIVAVRHHRAFRRYVYPLMRAR